MQRRGPRFISKMAAQCALRAKHPRHLQDLVILWNAHESINILIAHAYEYGCCCRGRFYCWLRLFDDCQGESFRFDADPSEFL